MTGFFHCLHKQAFLLRRDTAKDRVALQCGNQVILGERGSVHKVFGTLDASFARDL